MRIIDKNTDFYDYLQNVYRDESITFDRTDSYVLTKDIMCDHLYLSNRQHSLRLEVKNWFVLLQVCNTFWLFLLGAPSISNCGRPTSYETELLATWKNYNKKGSLIKLNVITLGLNMFRIAYRYSDGRWVFDKQNILNRLQAIINLIDTNDFEVLRSIDKHTIYRGDNTKVEKHLPLLKASGLSSWIDPLSIYLSLEEFFSLEKQSTERTASIGITDKEKIENHGFDTTISFRGRQNAK